MTDKQAFRSREEFSAWIESKIADRCDAMRYRMWIPTSFPCIVCYFVQDERDSMTWAESLHCEFIYLDDILNVMSKEDALLAAIDRLDVP